MDILDFFMVDSMNLPLGIFMLIIILTFHGEMRPNNVDNLAIADSLH